ncbi:dihydroneopterin aldolase [Enterococcus sp. LJL90]
MGKIRINNLKYFTKNGVLKEERVLGQQIEIDVELRLDLTAAGKSDDVADTVSYAEINDLIAKRVTTSSYNLMEGLAAAILDDIQKDFDSRLTSVLLRIRKYSVPMPGLFDNIEIEMERAFK